MLDHGAIRRLLPHGHPMVLVDRIEALDPGRSAVGVKAISACEPCYRDLRPGLEPGAWAYPASLLLESFGQTAALLWLSGRESPGLEEDRVLMLAGVRGCRFEGRAFPGDVVRHVARLDQVSGDNVFVAGESFAGQSRVMRVGWMLAVARPRSSLPATAPLAAAARG
jgi:3-hydroxyacyl-[acyl-carrier-protein] dehydratase